MPSSRSTIPSPRIFYSWKFNKNQSRSVKFPIGKALEGKHLKPSYKPRTKRRDSGRLVLLISGIISPGEEPSTANKTLKPLPGAKIGSAYG